MFFIGVRGAYGTLCLLFPPSLYISFPFGVLLHVHTHLHLHVHVHVRAVAYVNAYKYIIDLACRAINQSIDVTEAETPIFKQLDLDVM